MPFSSVTGDISLFYTDEGSGQPTLLFIHGYSCDSHDWSWQIPFFAQRYRVLAVDIRGHGRSSVPKSGYRHQDFASDLANLLNTLGIGPVVAIGHSLGAVIASTLAIEHPDLICAVVSIDPGYLVSNELAADMVSFIQALHGPDPVTAAQSLLGNLYTPASPAALRCWHMRRLVGTPIHVLRETLTDLFRGLAPESISVPYLAQRKCPVLALHREPTRAAVESALFESAESKVVTFEGSGHWLHQERPSEVNQVIEAWLRILGDRRLHEAEDRHPPTALPAPS